MSDMKHSESHPLTVLPRYPGHSRRFCKWTVFFSFWWCDPWRKL